MKRPRSVMLVTQAFPPEAVVGAHRMLALCRHLVERNYRVSVVTSHPAQDAAVDESLVPMIPAQVKVISTAGVDLPLLAARILKPKFLKTIRGKKADRGEKSESRPVVPGEDPKKKQTVPTGFRFVVDWLSWWLHIPDGSTGWLPSAVAAGLVQAVRSRPDVIFASAPPWSSFLAGTLISRCLGVPLVSDFRDPWCGSAFLRVPYAAHDSVNTLLEKMVVRHSSRITCAWDGIRKHLIRRYPETSDDISTIINGFNPELLEGIEAISIDTNDTKRTVFLHTGGFYGPRSPEPILAALQCLKSESPETASRVLVVFLGPTTYNGQPIEQIVEGYGVQEYVRILPRVSHRESLGILKGADVALLFGQSGIEALATIPAKALEYIGLRKPVMAIGAGEEVCNVIRRGGCPIWQLSADDPKRIASAMTEILQSELSHTDPSSFDPVDRDSLTQRYMAQQMEQVLISSCLHGKSREKIKR